MNTMDHDGAREIERAIHDGYDRWFDGDGTAEAWAQAEWKDYTP